MSKRTRSRKRRKSSAKKRTKRRTGARAVRSEGDSVELAEFLGAADEPEPVRPEFRDALRDQLWVLLCELREEEKRPGN